MLFLALGLLAGRCLRLCAAGTFRGLGLEAQLAVAVAAAFGLEFHLCVRVSVDDTWCCVYRDRVTCCLVCIDAHAAIVHRADIPGIEEDPMVQVIAAAEDRLDVPHTLTKGERDWRRFFAQRFLQLHRFYVGQQNQALLCKILRGGVKRTGLHEYREATFAFCDVGVCQVLQDEVPEVLDQLLAQVDASVAVGEHCGAVFNEAIHQLGGDKIMFCDLTEYELPLAERVGPRHAAFDVGDMVVDAVITGGGIAGLLRFGLSREHGCSP